MKKYLTVFLIMIAPTSAFAWAGYDADDPSLSHPLTSSSDAAAPIVMDPMSIQPSPITPYNAAGLSLADVPPVVPIQAPDPD